MIALIHSVIPYLFGLTFLWFLLSIVIWIVRMVSVSRISEPEQNRLAKKKAAKIVHYPIIVFVLLVVLYGLLSVATG